MSQKFEHLLGVSPLFSAFEDGLLFVKEVRKLGNEGSTKARWLVIAKFGLFLLNRKVFPRVFQIRQSISYRNLNSLIVTNSNLTLVGHRVHYTLTCKNHMKTAARIFYIRGALFDHPSIPFTLEIDRNDRDAFEKEVYQYRTESLLADRFTACLMESGAAVDEIAARQVCESLASVKRSVTIDPVLANSQYIKEACTAISYDREITELKLTKISMKYMFPHLADAIRYSVSIRKLVMVAVDFDCGPTAGLKRLFSEMFAPSIEEFVFEHCSFESSNSKVFFDCFVGYQGETKVLSFPRCLFCKDSLDSLFQALFFSPCLHSLSALLLSDASLSDELTSYISQLSCCEWMLEKQCLHTLSITKSGLELGRVLPHLLQLDSGYVNLDLSSNMFLESVKDLHFHSLCSLDISSCVCSEGSLMSLLVSLRDNLDHNFRLIASNIGDVSNAFYVSLQDMVIQHLSGLVWDRNPMDFPDFQAFCTFLQNQPNLTEISICKCIVDCDERFPAVLATVVTNKPIEVARLVGNCMGIGILPVVDQLVRNGILRILDISDNKVGDRIMDLVVGALPTTLKEFYFAGYEPSDVNSIFRVCEALLTYRTLVHASWPSNDIKPALKNLTPVARPTVFKVVQQLRQKFIDRFGYSNDMSIADTNEMMSKFTTMVNTAPLVMPKMKHHRQETNDKKSHHSRNSNPTTKFIEYDSTLTKMIQECGYAVGDDPLLTILREIDSETDIPVLASGLVQPSL